MKINATKKENKIFCYRDRTRMWTWRTMVGNVFDFWKNKITTLKPRFNESEGTEYLVFFIAGSLLLQGLFTIKLTTEGLEIEFFMAQILYLKGSLQQGVQIQV
jgi:hypothetical protein